MDCKLLGWTDFTMADPDKQVERRAPQPRTGQGGFFHPRLGGDPERGPFTIRRKLAAAFGATALVLLVGVVSFAAVRHLVSGFAANSRSIHVTTELRELAGWHLEAENAVRGFLLTGDEELLEQHAAATRAAARELAHLGPELAERAEFAPDVQALRRAAAEKTAALESLLAIARASGRQTAVDRVQAGAGGAETDSLRAVIQRIADAESGVLLRQTGERERDINFALLVIGGGGLLAFALLALILKGIRQDVARETFLQRDLLETAQRLDAQSTELELQNEQLQDQAIALEEQSSELEAQQTELEAANDELLRANAEVESARERFRLLLESAESGVYGIDVQGHCTFMNPAGARMLGYEYSELIGRKLHDIAHHTRPDGSPYPATECPIMGSLASRTGVRLDTEVYWRKDGTPFAVDYTAAPIVLGDKVEGVVVTFLDITARKREHDTRGFLADATAALNSSLDYRATLKTVAELAVPRLADWCVVDIREDGELQRVALAHSDPRRLHLVQELTAKRPPRLDAPLGSGKIISTGQAELYEELPEDLLIASAEGDVELIRAIERLELRSLLGVPLIVNGKTLGAIVCVMAESRRRYTKEDLGTLTELAARASLAVENALLFMEAEAARTRAENADRAKSQFLASMSHELRTPLNAIGGYAELLLVGVHGPVADKQRQALERIVRSQKALLGLINDILNFSKLQAGFVQIAAENLRAVELFDSIDAWVEPQLRIKKLRYSYEPCSADVLVRGDRDKIQQVMLNLLSNAVKFTPEGGAITVRCGTRQRTVQVSVSDTGPGVPEDKLEPIFEPFVQITRDGHPSLPGTGLGLAISRDLARAMGGDLRAENQSGGGAKFVLTLPRAQ